MTLYDDIKDMLQAYNLKEDDIKYVGIRHSYGAKAIVKAASWKKFKEMAKRVDAADVMNDWLVIMGKNWWMDWRVEENKLWWNITFVPEMVVNPGEVTVDDLKIL